MMTFFIWFFLCFWSATLMDSKNHELTKRYTAAVMVTLLWLLMVAINFLKL